MKKLFLLSTMMLVALMAQAQGLKIAPTMKKGDVKTYVSTSKTNTGGKEITVCCEPQYTVLEATPTGYVIQMKTQNVTTDAGDDIMGRLLGASTELMASTVIEVETDKDGQPIGLRNYEKVKEQMTTAAGKVVEELKKAIPNLEDMMPSEMLQKQLMQAMSEEALVRYLKLSNSPFALNGKTISTGAQDEYVNNQDMKMKRMYFVNGKDKITTTATLNLSQEELKQLIIDKVTEMAPDQAEAVKQNIDMVLASGMMKIEGTEKANYELGADGWMKSISTENETDAMGQKVKSSVTFTLK